MGSIAFYNFLNNKIFTLMGVTKGKLNMFNNYSNFKSN